MTGEVMPEEPDRSETQAGDTGFDLVLELTESWRVLLLLPLLVGVAALGITYAIAPTFTGRTTFLPPQQQGAGATALASLGALANLAGGAAGIRVPADQFVALMQSVTVQDRLIDRFELIKVYEAKLRVDARKELAANTRISLNKRDGLITVEVDDESPLRAAQMANAQVEELRRLTSTLAITEAQQRRAFFEKQLAQVRDRLTNAQQALQASGFGSGALKAEPKAAAEGYARLKAEITAGEVRLQSLRGALTDTAPEVTQLQSALLVLRGQLVRAEQVGDPSGSSDYVGKYREFKYQETLFDLLARQYELARVDEAREGALIQVIDTALPPERKTKPRRALTAIAATAVAALLAILWILFRRSLRRMQDDPRGAAQLGRLRQALRGH
jgi:uncharacterized protein involved in exopolysaccharide biosynthesis